MPLLDEQSLRTGSPPQPLTRSRMFKLRNVRLFEAGRQKDEEYSTEDIDSMVENFRAYSKRSGGQALFEVPIVLGHDKVQILLKLTGLPAAGWLGDVRAKWDVVDVPKLDGDGQPVLSPDGTPETEPHEGYFAIGDIDGAPEVAAQWIIDGQYRYLSVELNKRDQAPPGLQVKAFKGVLFTRIAILGGSNPYVKTLGPLPMPELDLSAEPYSVFAGFDPIRSSLVCFSLPPAGKRGGMSCFSEEPQMNEQLMQKLMAQGVPQEAAEAMAKLDPGCYATVAKAYADAGGGSGFDRTAAIEKLGAMPNADREALSKMTDEELQALMAKNGFASDPKNPADADPNTPKDPPFGGNKAFSSVLTAQRRIETQFKDFDAWRKQQDAKGAAEAKARRDRELAEKGQQADVFCADMVRERRVTPGQAKAYAVTLKRLASVPADEVVTFSADGTEKKGSPFEALMAEIKAMPQMDARFFAATGMPAGGTTLGNGQKADPARVKRLVGATTEGREAMEIKEAKRLAAA